MLLNGSIIVDTSIFIEYIVEDSPFITKIDKLLRSKGGKYILYTVPQVISETLYIASRLYREADEDGEANQRALEYIKWLSSIVKVAGVKDLSLDAGELRKEMRLSLTDCYIIVSARRLNGKALFLKPEREMLKYIDKLRGYNVIFLSELKI